MKNHLINVTLWAMSGFVIFYPSASNAQNARYALNILSCYRPFATYSGGYVENPEDAYTDYNTGTQYFDGEVRYQYPALDSSIYTIDISKT